MTVDHRDRLPFTGTHKANPFNSTDFTDCCGVAVLPLEGYCPVCNRPVLRIGSPRTNGKCQMCGKPIKECYC